MPFQKGESGNPAGRPARPAQDHYQSVLIEHFDAAAEARVVKAIIRAAQRGNVRAANWLWEHKHGKRTEIETQPVTVKVVYEDGDNPWATGWAPSGPKNR